MIKKFAGIDINACRQMERAHAGLVLDSCFWATKVLGKTWIVDNSCATGWTDGTTYGYNEAWINTLTLPQVKGFSAHEAGHNMLLHPFRRGDRDPADWNEACDRALNGILIDSGFDLPAGYLFDPVFDSGKTAEEIFTRIHRPDKKNKGQGQGQDPGRCGEVRDFPSPSGQPKATPAERGQAEQAEKIQTQQALSRAGNLPASLARLINAILEPVIPWREILARFVGSHATNDYTWMMPNQRYAAHGLYLPSLRNPELGQLMLAVDTSGSISQTQINSFVGEIRGILQAYKNTGLTVIFCDHAIRGLPITIDSDDDAEMLRPKGGGGTSFVPPFVYASKNDIPKALIYFTDGRCHDFPSPPEYDTLWVITGKNDSFRPPFGETIYMER